MNLLHIGACERCPFYLSPLIPTARGSCSIGAYAGFTDGQALRDSLKDPVTRQPRRITDPEKVPGWCPLRTDPQVVFVVPQ